MSKTHCDEWFNDWDNIKPSSLFNNEPDNEFGDWDELDYVRETKEANDGDELENEFGDWDELDELDEVDEVKTVDEVDEVKVVKAVDEVKTVDEVDEVKVVKAVDEEINLVKCIQENIVNLIKVPQCGATSEVGAKHAVFMTNFTKEMREAVDYLTCNRCRNRMRKYLTYRNKDGNPCLMPDAKNLYHETFHGLWEAARTGTINRMSIVTSDMFKIDAKGGHIHISMRTGSDVLDHTSYEIEKYYRALKKYDYVVHSMFITYGQKGILGNLQRLKDAIEKDPDGDHILNLNSVNWLLACIPEDYKTMSRLDRIRAHGCAILSSVDYEDDYETLSPIDQIRMRLVRKSGKPGESWKSINN
mgnify:CR=1 FL=1